MQQEEVSEHINFRIARARVEEKDKSLRSKVMGLDEAVKRFIKEGDHVAIGGSLYTRTPMASVYEILRQKIGNLSVSRGLAGFETDLLVVGGNVKGVVTSWWSPGYAWGSSRVMRDFVENDRLDFEEWSHSALALRYKAAAMGISFLPTFSMIGSDLQRVNQVKEIICPFTHEKVLLIPALYPDTGIIHAHRADKFGNVQIEGYQFMDQDIARASQRVIVTAEEIVETELFRREPDRTAIPFFCVDAVVEVPHGAYPGECWNLYETDFDHLTHYSGMVKRDGVDGVSKYLEEYVYTPKTFKDFLKLIGGGQLNAGRKAFKDVLS